MFALCLRKSNGSFCRSLRHGCSRCAFRQCATPIPMAGGACFVMPCCGSFLPGSRSPTALFQLADFLLLQWRIGRIPGDRSLVCQDVSRAHASCRSLRSFLHPNRWQVLSIVWSRRFPFQSSAGCFSSRTTAGLTGELAYALSRDLDSGVGCYWWRLPHAPWHPSPNPSRFSLCRRLPRFSLFTNSS